MIESFLEEEIGLSAEAVGPELIAKAVGLRIADLGMPDLNAYRGYLERSKEEQAALIEAVVVPETWFFRNRKAFDFLVNYVTGTWRSENPGRRLQALSIPCSTGEEAYSIAMALMDAGVQNDRFHIDGVDISETALARARTALYDRASFRGDNLSFRERYFDIQEDGFQLHDDVRKTVRFFRGNVLNDRLLMNNGPYDIIFCRNLLIYLSPQAKQRTLEAMSRLLTDSGIVFLGHAERQAAVAWGLVGIPEFGVFACRKERRKRARSPQPGVPARARQRRFEKVGRNLEPTQTAPLTHRIDNGSETRTQAQTPNNKAPVIEQENLFDEAQRLADRGSLSSALTMCQNFLNKHPIHVQAHFLMGLIYEALDNAEKAEEFFNKALYLNPEHSEALNHLSFAVEHRGDKVRAAHLRRRAQRVSRKLAEI